jgi:hypothetical protein
VSGSLSDPQRVIAPSRAPRDARRSQIVEGDVFAMGVACDEFAALDACLDEVLTERTNTDVRQPPKKGGGRTS